MASTHHYPADVLHSSLVSYNWSRRLLYKKLTGKRIDPTTGTLAGTMGVPYETMRYTLDALSEAANFDFEVDPTNYACG